MRTASVNGRTGFVVARGMGPNDGKVFVLFDGDNASESAAGWFSVESVTVTGTVPVNV